MNSSGKLLAIKLVHTAIWLFFVTIIFYVLYCGITDRVNLYTWIAVGLVMLEGIVLAVFKAHCPLTLVARKYSNSSKENFDIFLPNWIAKYNKEIFTSIFVIAVILVCYRLVG